MSTLEPRLNPGGYPDWIPFLQRYTIPDLPRPTLLKSEAMDLFNNLAVSRIPRWAFGARGISVIATRAITIHISKGETMFFAENDALGLYAAGQTPHEALEEFEHQVVHFVKHYESVAPRQLMGEALNRKKLFGKLFHRIAD